MDLKSIHNMWTKDCHIDSMHLDDASRQSPLLHAKYLELLSTSKLQLKKVEMEQKVLLKQKWLYYNGKMDQQSIEDLGWVFGEAVEITIEDGKIIIKKT